MFSLAQGGGERPTEHVNSKDNPFRRKTRVAGRKTNEKKKGERLRTKNKKNKKKKKKKKKKNKKKKKKKKKKKTPKKKKKKKKDRLHHSAHVNEQKERIPSKHERVEHGERLARGGKSRKNIKGGEVGGGGRSLQSVGAPGLQEPRLKGRP